MCVSYEPVSRQELKTWYRAPMDGGDDWKMETWQDYAAPFIVGDEEGRKSLPGLYSMIPKKKIPPGVRRFSTMNARSETIASLPSFASPWKNGQLCLVPMRAFFEPNYESGKAERWKISMADNAPFAVAGLYRRWTEPDGSTSFSFTQITVNANGHPLMQRFHKPGDEKRSLVIIPEHAYDGWLHCRNPEQARSFLKSYPAELMQASPVPPEPAVKNEAPGLF